VDEVVRRVVALGRPCLDAVDNLGESASDDGLVALVVCRQDAVPDIRNHVCNLPDRGNLCDARTDVYHMSTRKDVYHQYTFTVHIDSKEARV